MAKICIRQKDRLFQPHSPIFYEEFNEANSKILMNSDFSYQSVFEELIEKLIGAENSIDCKAECLITLNNNIQASPRFIKNYYNTDFLNSMFDLASTQPYICCLVYKFFTSLMKNFAKKLYPTFLELNIYKNTIDSIDPSLDHFTYHYILLFICETIRQIPDSIIHFIDCGIVKQLKCIDENDNVDQLLFIHSNILMHNEENGNSSISNVFNFLSKSKITTIANALYYIQKSLQKQDNDYIWKFAIADKRLSFLLEIYDVHIISRVIYCYTLICNFGEEAISTLIEEKSILNKIFQFILDMIEQKSSEEHQILIDNHIAVLSALELINSMIENSKSEAIIEEIYKIFIVFEFPKTISFFNFECKYKICQMSLNLLCKIGRNQAVELFTADFFDLVAQTLTTDIEKIEYFDLGLNIAKERFAVDDNFVKLIDEIQCKYCSCY